MLTAEFIKLRWQLSSPEGMLRCVRMHPEYNFIVLRGIYWQQCMHRIITSSHQVRKQGKFFVRLYVSGQSLLNIAKQVKATPVQVAREVLGLHLNLQRKNITRLLREPSLIEDKRLQEDVEACIDHDQAYGPHADRLHAALGLEYEQRLMDEVRNLRLEFESEEELRNRNCHKTPDILLRVPVSFCGKVVWWIDSKAKFADVTTLNEDYKQSICSYVNAYGPGMVIYWFGFVEDSDSPMMEDYGVLVVDSFPRGVQTLPGSRLSIPPEHVPLVLQD